MHVLYNMFGISGLGVIVPYVSDMFGISGLGVIVPYVSDMFAEPLG